MSTTNCSDTAAAVKDNDDYMDMGKLSEEITAITTSTFTSSKQQGMPSESFSSSPLQPMNALSTETCASPEGNNNNNIGSDRSSSTSPPPFGGGGGIGVGVGVGANTNALLNGSVGLGNTVGIGLGLSMMQSSPPPHSYRHSRAYRHFKNPPQPHMCIRTTTEAGEELFINVLSWTRIVIPQEPSDPIPLYGGMRVPPGSPRSPPVVFAVMANPEVLKDSGRHSKDPEERRAMVELMCDFVEAMNPGVKLVRNAVILKDRDISGELKDVWNAVQAQREREREEQILQQRQQQHYHNITTQQMFPRSVETLNVSQQQLPDDMTKALSTTTNEGNFIITTNQQQQQQLASDSHLQDIGQEDENPKVVIVEQNQQNGTSKGDTNKTKCCDIAENVRNGLDNKEQSLYGNSTPSDNSPNVPSQQHNSEERGDQTDASNVPSANANANKHENIRPSNNIVDNATNQTAKHKNNQNAAATSPTSPTNAAAPTPPTAVSTATTTSTSTSTTSATGNVTTAAPTKKEKLGGFLPNGCIFPRFKNNKNKEKDKDKEKEKESKSKDKEKTLLNALKKSKEKKVAPIEQPEKASSEVVADGKSQYEKNCINLENEMQKMDLNKMDSSTNSDNIFIKLKVTASSAAAK